MARYLKVVLLGSGSFGQVWVVDTQSSTGKQKVLKEITLRGLGDKGIGQALTEVTILAKCSHENIIGYTEAFVDEMSTTLSIVMDYASGGDLHKQITQRRGLYFPNETVLCWFAQLGAALSYIHKRGILHRDIKPQNLFLNDMQVLKLGDFGISRILHGNTDVANTFVGTPFYLSPEICNQQPHCNDLLNDFVCSLLISDPSRRLTADDVLLLPTLEDYIDEIPKTSSELLGAGVAESVFRGRQPSKYSKGIKMEKSLKPKKVKTSKGSSSERESALCEKEAKDKQDSDRGICSTTYTVVKYPKTRHLSFASPELSAALVRQRTHVSEAERACSADAPRVAMSNKRKTPPKMNLLEAVQHFKSLKDDSDVKESTKMEQNCRDVLENATEAVYNSVIMESKPDLAAAEMLNLIQKTLGQAETEILITAVKNRMPFKDLQKRFNMQPTLVLAVLWYIQLSG